MEGMTSKNPMKESAPVVLAENTEQENRVQKKPWMWVADAIVWAACVAALVWVLSTTRTGVTRYLTFDNEYSEYATDSSDYVHEEDN